MQIIFYQHHFLKRKHKCERKLNDNDIESITLRNKQITEITLITEITQKLLYRNCQFHNLCDDITVFQFFDNVW